MEQIALCFFFSLCCSMNSENIIAELHGVSATFEVKLDKTNQGQLEVDLPTSRCNVQADNIHTTTSGVLG